MRLDFFRELGAQADRGGRVRAGLSLRCMQNTAACRGGALEKVVFLADWG